MSVPLYQTPAVFGLLACRADPPAAHRDLEKDREDRALSPVSADGLICIHLKYQSGFNHNYYTFTLMLPTKILLYGFFFEPSLYDHKCFDIRTAMQHTCERPISMASTKSSITLR